MNQKFGGGRQPTGTPSLAWSCVVVIASLLAGASVVHNIFKPDLVHLSLSLYIYIYMLPVCIFASISKMTLIVQQHWFFMCISCLVK
ncbi:hypothetical protein LguiA_034966 [Lonicera macranthoides]